MKKIFFIIAILNIGLYANAQTYNAEIKFYIQNLGATVEGTLQGFEGDINFNAENPGSSGIMASVDVSTISTGINMRDNHLQAKKFFHVEEHPEIIMKSREIIKQADGSFLGTFDLTIKGTTKAVEVPFTYSKSSNTETFSGSFTINRRDFDVGGALVPSGDEVEVEIGVVRFGG
ncbi:MAG: YceI family protein [Bacteroidales bacterium]